MFVDKKINQFEITEVVMARISDILSKAKEELDLLTSKKMLFLDFFSKIVHYMHNFRRKI